LEKLVKELKWEEKDKKWQMKTASSAKS
jgi:hypothetical protein